MLLFAPLLALVGFAAVVGVPWYYATLLKREALDPDYGPWPYDLDVAAVADRRLLLRRKPGEKAPELGEQGIFGLEWPGGYARLGSPLESSQDGATRELEDGAPAPPEGAPARLDAFAFTGDPLTAHGLPFTAVDIATPLGVCPAWLVPGARPGDWVIAVHGKGASRREALRALPAFDAASYTSLLITYRNDEGAPADPRGYRYGATEWEDLEAAVAHAVREGAQRVVLVGYSMGGGIAWRFLERSPLKRHVVGLVLDAPALDLRAIVEAGSRDAGMPGPVIWLGCLAARLRHGLRWDELRYIDRAGDLDVPVLLFHGAGDTRVPIGPSDRLARNRPDIVTYVRHPFAGHVRTWNVDPEGYTTAIRHFLEPLAGG